MPTCRLRFDGSLRLSCTTEHRRHVHRYDRTVTIASGQYSEHGEIMIKRRRGWRPLARTAVRRGDADASCQDDAQQLLAEWNRQILDQQFAARQRRVPIDEAPRHTGSFDEIDVVSRIGQPTKTARTR